MISNNEDIEINICQDIQECKDCKNNKDFQNCNEKETYYECVICMNKIDNEPNYFKFNCDHKKYMHNECIVNVDKCPLCRQLSNYTYFQNLIESIKNGFFFILKLLYFPIFFAIIYLILRFISN